MTSRQMKTANLISAHRDARGYLTRCRHCRSLIYIKQDYDGVWRPYESWVEGNVDENEWRRHDCCGVATRD